MEELDNQIANLYQEMGRGQGINDSLMIRLFSRLYMEPDPIAMEDLAKETGYSLASISNKINMLAPVLQIKKIKKPGSKKIFLYMEKDMLGIWKDIMLKKEEYVINRAKEKLPHLIKEYRGKAKSDRDKKKLKIIEDYYSQILKFECIFNMIAKKLVELGK